MKILVTEAYSSSNIGDLELVEQTINVVRKKYPGSSIVCLAVDPQSFVERIPHVEFRESLFPRLSYLKSGRAGKLVTALSWFTQIVLLSFSSVLKPTSQQTFVQSLSRFGFISRSALFYIDADRVVAVGGGYLGDQYKKHSLLTMWSWWFAAAIKKPVETMPVSVEFSSSQMRIAVRSLANSIAWRVRDTPSEQSLRAAGVKADLIPDLAFANFSKGLWRPNSNRSGLLIALVGDDYLSSSELDRLQQALVTAIKQHSIGRRVLLLSMHSSMSGTNVGADERASHTMVERLASEGISSEIVHATNYDQVCQACSSAETVISARMHAGIAAFCAGAKVGLLAYEEKHTALMSDMGLSEYVIDIRASADDVIKLVQRLVLSSPLPFIDAAERHHKRLITGLGLDNT